VLRNAGSANGFSGLRQALDEVVLNRPKSAAGTTFTGLKKFGAGFDEIAALPTVSARSTVVAVQRFTLA